MFERVQHDRARVQSGIWSEIPADTKITFSLHIFMVYLSIKNIFVMKSIAYKFICDLPCSVKYNSEREVGLLKNESRFNIKYVSKHK